MKKVLLIHHHSEIGGAGLSLIHIIKSLDKSKYEVTVLCPNKSSNEMINLIKNEECTVVPTGSSPKIFPHYNGGVSYAISIRTISNIISIIKDKKNMKEYIEKYNPDIIAVNSMTLCWIGIIIKKMNKKIVCFHRETYQKGILGCRTKIIKYLLSNYFDKIAFISNNDFIETGKTKAIKQVIYDRVEIDKYNNYDKLKAREILNLEKNKKYLLYLGGFSKLKGSLILIKAMTQIKDNNINLIFVGNCDSEPCEKKCIKDKIKNTLRLNNKDNIMRICKKRKLYDKIVFMNRSENPELYYKACDVIIFPSTKAHQARPIYEAGISKIPIIITDFKQTEEFAKNEYTAVTFKRNSSLDLANKIKKVIYNEINLENIIKNNFDQALSRHNITTLKEDLDELFSL